MKTLAAFLAVFSLSLGAKLPPQLQSCKGSENFNACLKTAVQDALAKLENGISDLGVPPLQPLNVPSVTIGEGTGAVHVVQNYKNFNIFGLSTGKIQKFDSSVSPAEVKIELELFNPESRFEADYDFNGRILLLPIVGNGKCQVVLKDLKTNLKLLADSFEKKGVKYLRVKDIKVDLTPGKVEYNFENLFNGDERLGKEMNKVLNENWKDVFGDVKDGYNKMLEAIFKDYTDKIFSKIPYDDFF